MLFFLKGDLPVISLTVTGIPVQSEEDITLLSFFARLARLNRRKRWMQRRRLWYLHRSRGRKKVKACTQTLSRFEGKSVQTVEGLSPREKEVYVYCFGEAGAVQCGFCTPGMVICAKRFG
jgi:hypothetical protein